MLERGAADVRIHKEEWGEERKVHTYQPGRWAVLTGPPGCLHTLALSWCGGQSRGQGAGLPVGLVTHSTGVGTTCSTCLGASDSLHLFSTMIVWGHVCGFFRGPALVYSAPCTSLH